MFFNKKKEEPVFLDCYTYSHHAYNYAKIDYAHKYIPQWWKDEKNTTQNGPKMQTIKKCRAFIDYYFKGIVIPLWGEVDITVNKKPKKEDLHAPAYTWVSSNLDFDLHSHCHSVEQWKGFSNGNNGNRVNIKFKSPWVFKTKDLIYFTWNQPTWNQSDTLNGFTALPAVTQFKTQPATHINYIVEQNQKEQKFNLQPLTPIIMMHPMTERKVQIRHHLVDKEKFQLLSERGGGMILGSSDDEINKDPRKFYAQRKRFWDKSDELNKCPFE